MVKEELGHITAGTHPEMSVIYSLNLQRSHLAGVGSSPLAIGGKKEKEELIFF